MDRTPVIAGIGLSDYPVAPDLDSVQHHALAYQRVLADCGVEKSAIDAYIGAGGSREKRGIQNAPGHRQFCGYSDKRGWLTAGKRDT